MPILAPETDMFPEGVLEPDATPGRNWYALHTRPRQEKSLARCLLGLEIPFYLPQVLKRWRRNGRRMESRVPLFSGYVFMAGTDEERVRTLATNRVAKVLRVGDPDQLLRDLGQVYRLIQAGAPITPEQRLTPGTLVEIRGGPLAGLKGRIRDTASGRRFVVQVDFIQQGASILLDDYCLVRAD